MVEVPRKVVSTLLGSKACTTNDNDERVCVYFNAGADGRVYVKVVVDGEKVAYGRFDPDDLIALLAPVVLTKNAKGKDIKRMWNALKEEEREGEEEEEDEYEGREERKARRRKTAKREKKSREEKEEESREEEEELPFE